MKKISILIAAVMLMTIAGCVAVKPEQTITKETLSAAETTAAVETTVTEETTVAEETAETTVAEITAEEINEAAEWQTIGDDSMGYIDLPKNWVRFFDPSTYGTGMLQYSSPDLSAVVSLLVYNEALVENGVVTAEQLETLDAKTMATSSYMTLEQSGLSEMEAAQVTLGGIPAYQVYGIYNEGGEAYLFICWYFDGDDGYVHYVCAETPFESSMETVGYIEGSYRLP